MDGRFEEVLDLFDFGGVQKVMQSLQIQWDDKLPTINEMKYLCLRCFDECLKQLEIGKCTSSSCMKNNYKVTVTSDHVITIDYILLSATSTTIVNKIGKKK